MIPTLYHYTCRHRAEAIDAAQVLLPNQHPELPLPLVWLTDLDHPWREALGLTSVLLSCDRTECRYTVADPVNCVPWWAAARALPPVAREAVEAEPGGMPMHWWISRYPVPVLARQPVPA